MVRLLFTVLCTWAVHLQGLSKTWNPRVPFLPFASPFVPLTLLFLLLISSHTQIHPSIQKMLSEIEQERQAFRGVIWQGRISAPCILVDEGDLSYFLLIFLIYKSCQYFTLFGIWTKAGRNKHSSNMEKSSFDKTGRCRWWCRHMLLPPISERGFCVASLESLVGWALGSVLCWQPADRCPSPKCFHSKASSYVQ